MPRRPTWQYALAGVTIGALLCVGMLALSQPADAQTSPDCTFESPFDGTPLTPPVGGPLGFRCTGTGTLVLALSVPPDAVNAQMGGYAVENVPADLTFDPAAAGFVGYTLSGNWNMLGNSNAAEVTYGSSGATWGSGPVHPAATSGADVIVSLDFTTDIMGLVGNSFGESFTVVSATVEATTTTTTTTSTSSTTTTTTAPTTTTTAPSVESEILGTRLAVDGLSLLLSVVTVVVLVAVAINTRQRS